MSLLEIVVNQRKDQISKNINTDMTPNSPGFHYFLYIMTVKSIGNSCLNITKLFFRVWVS